MAQSDSDRKLYEYQRQLKAPKVLSEKYPNIAKAMDPYILSKSDEQNYNTLGKNTQQDYGSRTKWIRDAEATAGNALANDIYKTDSPEKLADILKDKNKLSYSSEGKSLHSPMYGMYYPQDDLLQVNTDYPKKDQLDTIIHEVGHALDYKKNKEAAKKLNLGEEPPASNDQVKAWNEAFKNKDLYKLSDLYSTGHFLNPRSHSINELINQTKSGMQEQGIYPMPDTNPEYNELNVIKPTVKSLEGYALPEEQDNSYFAKLRALLGK